MRTHPPLPPTSYLTCVRPACALRIQAMRSYECALRACNVRGELPSMRQRLPGEDREDSCMCVTQHVRNPALPGHLRALACIPIHAVCILAALHR